MAKYLTEIREERFISVHGFRGLGPWSHGQDIMTGHVPVAFLHFLACRKQGKVTHGKWHRHDALPVSGILFQLALTAAILSSSPKSQVL